MHNPDVILGIDSDAGNRTQHPMVRKRLGPERIYLKPRRLSGGLSLSARSCFTAARTTPERPERCHNDKCNEERTNKNGRFQLCNAHLLIPFGCELDNDGEDLARSTGS